MSHTSCFCVVRVSVLGERVLVCRAVQPVEPVWVIVGVLVGGSVWSTW